MLLLQFSACGSRIYHSCALGIALLWQDSRAAWLCWGHGLAASSARTPGHVGTAGLSSTTAQEEVVSLLRVTHLTALDFFKISMKLILTQEFFIFLHS